MLYTRFVIGEETLSSTSAFSFCHCAISSATTKSFVLSSLLGNNGSYRKRVEAKAADHASCHPVAEFAGSGQPFGGTSTGNGIAGWVESISR